MELGDGFGGRGLYGIGNRDEAGKLAVGAQEHDRLALFAPRLCGLGKRRRGDTEAFHEPRIAERRHAPANASLDALTGDGLEALDLGRLQTALLSAAQNRRRKRMLAASLQGGCKAQHLVGLEARRYLDPGQRRLAFGQRPGLVDDDGIDQSEPLERRGIAHQHAGMRAAPGGDHDGDRRGKPERAWAGDDEHADGGDERVSELRRRSEQEPDDEGEHRHGDHGRHEIARHGIGETLDRRAGALRGGDHGHDLGKRRLLPGAIDAHVEAAGAVERAAGDAVAGRLLHRNRLAGQQGLIDGASALDDDAVDGDLVAWPDPQHVAGLDRGERHGLGLAILQHTQRRLGREVEQSADGAAGLLPGAELEHLAEQHERHDDGGGLVIDRDEPMGVAHGVGEQPRRDRGDQAVEKGSPGAEPDQGEHVEPARADRGEPAYEKRPAAPQHRRGGQRELEPLLRRRRQEGQQIAPEDVGAHVERHEGERERHGHLKPAGEIDELGVRHVDGERAHGLERHAANRAGSRLLPHDFRMHRAGVERALRQRLRLSGLGQITRRVARELDAAAV